MATEIRAIGKTESFQNTIRHRARACGDEKGSDPEELRREAAVPLPDGGQAQHLQACELNRAGTTTPEELLGNYW